MRTIWSPHLKGHSIGYSKAPSQLKSICRVTFEVKVKSYKKFTTTYSFSKLRSIKTTSCENNLTSPPQRTLYRLFKRTISAQIYWSGDLWGQGQKYKKITIMYSFSKVCSIRTTSCENKPTSPPCKTLYRLLKNTNSTQILWSGDPRGQGQTYKIIINMYPFSKICSIKTTSCENKLTSSLSRTRYWLFKNINPAQIH